MQLVRAPEQQGWKRHCNPALWQSVLDIESQFEAILDERLDRGLEQPAGGYEDVLIGFMAKGKLRKKKLWHKSRFYHDMTNFYSASERHRIWTKPTIELKKGMSRVESMALDSPGGRSFRDDSPSPQRSPKRGGGRVGRSPTKEIGSLASTDYALPKIEEDNAES